MRKGHVDKPGIIGSHWWNKELAEATALRSRRNVLIAVAVSALGIAALGTAAFALARDDDTREEQRRTLELQRDFGWSFGATSETVAFDAQYTTAYAREALPRLVADLTPVDERLRPWSNAALFQAPEASPRLPPSEPDAVPATKLADALRPIHTPSMVVAEAAGAALAELLVQANGGRVAVVLDLDGAEAVAAAAGAADLMEPVFLFDNWPHPRGVVAAHLTLAAAVYHQPRFAQAAQSRRKNAAPVFVLDRRRLSPYSDDALQFDNRWLAKLPLAADFARLEIRRVLYVVATQAQPPELRDVAFYLDEWSKAGIDVRALALDAFEPTAADGKVRFGGTAQASEGFYGHYPWKTPAKGPTPVTKNEQMVRWRPQPPAPDPADRKIGLMTVVVAAATGAVVGSRSGSWNRASGGWGG